MSLLSSIADCTLLLISSAGLTTSGKRVTAWADQSGAGNDPSFSVGPYFDGSTDDRVAFGFDLDKPRLDLPAGVPIDRQSFTVVLIGRLNAISPPNSGIILGFDSPGIFCQINANTLQFPSLALTSLSAIPAGPAVFILRFSASAVKFQLNGYSESVAAASSGTRSGNASLGNSVSFPSDGCPMSLWEVATFSRALTDVEVSNILAYGVATYGAVLNPLKRLVGDGDSIGFGLYGNGTGTGYASTNDGWLSLLQLPAGCEVQNIAIPGQTMQFLAANVNSRVLPLISGMDRCAVICEASTNDLAAGRTAAQVFADQQTYGNAVKSAGGFVAFTTTTPRPGIETERQQLRSLLLADFSGATSNPRVWKAGAGVTYGDVLIDVGNNPTIGQSGQSGDTTYYVDGLHPSGQGHVIYAQDVQDALAILFPPTPSGNLSSFFF